ncbi:MAG: L,D-transpeptidase family protein [Candidatus Omnitrophota bacterium]|jgi:lipoprotein-anchoring transpeptidase ErfK/SrfK|nr:L,D-transpeptidase family protein [Candidatus Omnitrophota bacterium]
MKKKIFLAIGLILAISVMLLVVSKIVTTGKPKASRSADVLKITNASKKEAELFNAASRYAESGDLLSAKDAYRQIVEKFPGSDNIQKAQEELENINIRILFSPIPTADSVSYEIQKGDTLAKIAKKFSNTQDMILKANNLKNPEIVPLGRKIKVHNEKFSIMVDKSQNTLTLKSGEKIVKTYRVSTGLNNSTPVGNFKIINKIVDPPWYTAGSVIPADSPKNILGSRWMGISAQSYGIHGTTEPQSIGRQVTLGCVRMKNAEVEELYNIVPEGTDVIIVD